MAQQSTVTITGFVGANPVSFGREGGSPACSFRLGSTRSYYHAGSREWRESPTTWITVKAFRTLASNVITSIRKGDAVLVSGVLNTESWSQDGIARTKMVIEANSIGHDLNRGVSSFAKMRAQQSTPSDTVSPSSQYANYREPENGEQTQYREQKNDREYPERPKQRGEAYDEGNPRQKMGESGTSVSSDTYRSQTAYSQQGEYQRMAEANNRVSDNGAANNRVSDDVGSVDTGSYEGMSDNTESDEGEEFEEPKF